MSRKPFSVSKNGNLVSKLVHQHTKNSEKGGKPHVEDLTEVDIPELDIHEKIMNNDGFESTIQAKRNVSKLLVVVFQGNFLLLFEHSINSINSFDFGIAFIYCV